MVGEGGRGAGERRGGGRRGQGRTADSNVNNCHYTKPLQRFVSCFIPSWLLWRFVLFIFGFVSLLFLLLFLLLLLLLLPKFFFFFFFSVLYTRIALLCVYYPTLQVVKHTSGHSRPFGARAYTHARMHVHTHTRSHAHTHTHTHTHCHTPVSYTHLTLPTMAVV